jgi:DNA-binding MarR family transcriptional regulator
METKELHEFRQAIRSLEREFFLKLKQETESCGVTLSQRHIITEIGERGETSIVELSSVLGLDPSTLSRNINNMVNLELVSRYVRPKDRRYVALKLTEKGQAICDTLNTIYNDHYKKIFELIPEENQRQVIDSFELFNDATQELKYRSNSFKECTE